MILDSGTSMIGMWQDSTNLRWQLICFVQLATWSSWISTGENISDFDLELDNYSVSFCREMNTAHSGNIQWAPLITLWIWLSNNSFYRCCSNVDIFFFILANKIPNISTVSRLSNTSARVIYHWFKSKQSFPKTIICKQTFYYPLCHLELWLQFMFCNRHQTCVCLLLKIKSQSAESKYRFNLHFGMC